MEKVCEGEDLGVANGRISPSRSPFPGTQLLQAVEEIKTYIHYRFKGSRPTTSFVNTPMRIPARTPATSSAGA